MGAELVFAYLFGRLAKVYLLQIDRDQGAFFYTVFTVVNCAFRYKAIFVAEL